MPGRHTLALALLPLLPTACATSPSRLMAEHDEIEEVLRRAIGEGSKNPKCAAKETALAEAYLEFAVADIEDHHYRRARADLDVARQWTVMSDANTSIDKCTLVTPIPKRLLVEERDLDDDGYVDRVDDCPDDPEDFDGFEDDDGCPDVGDDR